MAAAVSHCVGDADEMHDAAKRAAEEIPGARFVSLAGHSHISAFYEADALLLPDILELLRSATPTTVEGVSLRLEFRAGAAHSRERPRQPQQR